MAIFTGIDVGGGSLTEVTDALVALNRSLEYQMANLDDDNIRELDYSKMVGGPPPNADNTGDTLTVEGSNFTLVNGAYVYSGPANYSQISGGPPANADNTGLNLPASLGINFTKIGVNYIYTGTLSANQINAGTLNANYLNGGTISGITVQTGSGASGGTGVVLNSSNHLVTAYTDSSRYVQMNAYYSGESNPTLSFVNGGNRADMLHDGSQLFIKSSNSIVIAPGGFYGTTYMRGVVDFGGATVQGLNTTAKFG